MTLGNWNLQRANSVARRLRLITEIRRREVDVWVFTESNARLNLGALYPHQSHSAPGRDGPGDPDGPDAHWVSIRSKFPLRSLPTSDCVRTAAARIFPPQGAPFIVFGTVLPWIGSRWRGFRSRDGVAFRAALTVQLADWTQMRRDFSNDEFFVMGDFNQDLSPVHYCGSRANRAALLKALHDCGLKSLTCGESASWPESAKSACIDHICALRDSQWRANPAVRWPEAEVPDKRWSDHFGVSVTFSEAGNPPQK